jgi:hypothetical protein
MVISVLVSGYWMGGLDRFGKVCNVCNYDYSWIFNNPSTLIWADKIILTPFLKGIIDDKTYPDEDKILSNTIKEVFDIVDQYGMLEIKDPSSVITDKFLEKINEEYEIERSVFEKLYPNQVRIGDDNKVPGQLFVEGSEYCYPYIASAYSCLVLSKEWNATSLFSDRIFNYYKYKFGASLISQPYFGGLSNAFNTIFDTFLPELNIFPEFTYSNINQQVCPSCKNLQQCSRTYLKKLKNNMSKYLELRDYDEVIQIKQVISKIIKKIKDKNDVIENDIIKEFKNEERIITKKLMNTFPKIKRWSNIALIMSVPIASVGVATGLPVVSLAGVSIAGLSKIIDSYVKYGESKHQWVAFINRRTSSRQ